MGNALNPKTVEPGWGLRWLRESRDLLRAGALPFTVLYLALAAINMTWQPALLSFPIACGTSVLIMGCAMAVHGGITDLAGVLRAIRDLPWLGLLRLLAEITALILAILVLMLLLHRFLGNILSQDHLSAAANLTHTRQAPWLALPLWIRSWIGNALGNTQETVGNAFLILSMGIMLMGVTRHASVAFIAGFSGVLRNIRVWMAFLLASLLIEGMATALSGIIATVNAAILAALLSNALLLFSGVYGWCFVHEVFGEPGKRVAQKRTVKVGRTAAA
ncbi:hypothetical protein [Acidithiobacillus sulfuriphilus]|uniref:Uncharacterized protein n=2 Tax=Acidithiobacillus sulfuriphilus TaxID=1867749 RepID=A0A3M8R412_9PROT|nr:hypothetical protein [Acidithiobacillus sulfuriphilus]RNF63229.1 hypothetical protein EC580_06755 [Acidithiobacillus sulfuriphilus]